MKDWSHQTKTISVVKKELEKSDTLVGRIVYPTGGGKTRVEAKILKHIIKNDGRNVHLVLAPRIVLANQLLEECVKHIGNEFHPMAFHSGDDPDDKDVNWADIEVTTKVDVIKKEIKKCRHLHEHGYIKNDDLVIFCTYHSVGKLVDAGLEFDTLIADESQYCIQEDFFNDVKNIDAKVKLFFTATERISRTGAMRSNDNEEVFGKPLHQVTPKQLIAKGIIVPPRLHVLHATTQNDHDTTMDAVVRIAKKQIDITKNMGVENPKILFACKSTNQVKTVIQNIDKLKAEFPDCKIYTIISHADYGSCIDGERVSRKEFMRRLKVEKNALIFHYDILSEGIDVPGITGVALMRAMNKAKLMQTIGRALRGYPNKKFATVSVMLIDGDDENKNYVKEIVHGIREAGFEINFEEFDHLDKKIAGITNDNPLHDHAPKDKKKKPQTMFEAVLHEVEDEEDVIRREEIRAAITLDEVMAYFS